MAAVILPLHTHDLDEYAALMVRAEDLAEDEIRLEKQLKAVRLKKIEVDLKINNILARRPQC